MTKPLTITELAAALEGHRIAGGCDDCDAYQTVHRDPNVANLTHLNVHHDDTCPFLRELRR